MRTPELIPALLASALLSLAAAGCNDAPEAPAPVSKASQLQLTGVWVAVGTFENPAGPPPWSNTLWPAQPPFTPLGAAESRRLTDIRNVVPCQPGGPIFAMWEMGLFPIEILEARRPGRDQARERRAAAADLHRWPRSSGRPGTELDGTFDRPVGRRRARRRHDRHEREDQGDERRRLQCRRQQRGHETSPARQRSAAPGSNASGSSPTARSSKTR